MLLPRMVFALWFAFPRKQPITEGNSHTLEEGLWLQPVQSNSFVPAREYVQEIPAVRMKTWCHATSSVKEISICCFKITSNNLLRNHLRYFTAVP